MKKPDEKSTTWTFRTLNVSMDLRYSYDANGRITSRYEQSWMTNYTPELTTYQYDAAGRLTNVQYPSGMTEAYTYDNAGNRITLTNSITGTTYYTYDSENKLIYTNSSGNITNYAYDRMGNTISSGNSTMMTYDYERRLTAITLPSGDTVTYKYLPDGTRIMRANSTETEYYLYDREDRIGDYDTNGNLMIAYTHGPGMDEPVALNINASTYFYIPDIQGSIRAIVDIDGDAMATYVYDVWGNLISHNGPLSERNDYLYTGREYDWETGIYYYRYRYYNPEIGRFMQSSWELNEEMNMYVYVNNDPVKGVDPTGHPYFPPTLPDHGSGTPQPSNYNFCVCVCKSFYCACHTQGAIYSHTIVITECWQQCANCNSHRYDNSPAVKRHSCNIWHSKYRICKEYPWPSNPCAGEYNRGHPHRISSGRAKLIR